MGGLDRIRDDRQAGASQLARRALAMLADGAGGFADLEDVRREAGRISGLRPSMAAIEGAVRIFMQILEAAPGEDLGDAVRGASREAVARLDRMRERAAACALDVLGGVDHERVVTVSCSSTVMAVLDGRLPPALLVGEGRPGLEGRALARRYAERGVDVELCVDAALPGLMREGDLVLVGADSVQADGRLVNKIGSLALALRARDLGAGFYAVCETFKFSSRASVPLERKEPGEVWDGAPDGVGVINTYFERVPPGLVTAFLTDAGRVRHGRDPWPVDGGRTPP